MNTARCRLSWPTFHALGYLARPTAIDKDKEGFPVRPSSTLPCYEVRYVLYTDIPYVQDMLCKGMDAFVQKGGGGGGGGRYKVLLLKGAV